MFVLVTPLIICSMWTMNEQLNTRAPHGANPTLSAEGYEGTLPVDDFTIGGAPPPDLRGGLGCLNRGAKGGGLTADLAADPEAGMGSREASGLLGFGGKGYGTRG